MANHWKQMLGVCLAACVLLQGCASNAGRTQPGADIEEKKEAAPRATAAKPDVETIWDEEALRNDTGKIVIKSLTNAKTGAYHATVAVISKSGTAVIADPYSIPMQDGIPLADLVTISHRHPDHIDAKFLQKTKAKLSVAGAGESFIVGDMAVTSVPAAHDSNFDPAKPTNTIYIYETDGVRIAHLGDLGQDELTDEQLQSIGRVDIVFTALDGLSQYGRSAEKSIQALQQLHPAVIAATHYEASVVEAVLDALQISEKAELEELAIDRADIERLDDKQLYVMLK
ncbi:MBL fold metallo-hydrolase [Paenibacillus methanolicus]|uniref:L-ascorbate metabolism protein UlaG (Beta-lactamase superfamily) n=1 Tax=Paenibacillus methanolicus TaxID=582686 RepID=A0A5S5CK97_9BACL|nr:MBL fold metallo-hydrolase [Paenibacillus methanolicus]TYP79155.1 L-ascorbate metabolism protein UlaG (beta-lactamase superfamily) [Paenibacillus methanolicus]